MVLGNGIELLGMLCRIYIFCITSRPDTRDRAEGGEGIYKSIHHERANGIECECMSIVGDACGEQSCKAMGEGRCENDKGRSCFLCGLEKRKFCRAKYS